MPSLNKQQNDQPQGLRFDIYERIHLTEEAAGIAELEEIELLPRIQVVTHGDHAALRGICCWRACTAHLNSSRASFII